MRSSCAALIALLLAGAAPLSAQDFNTDVHTAPSPESAQRAQANAAFEAHDYERALKILLPLSEAHASDARLRYDLGSAQDALDQTSAAEQSFRAAIVDDPVFLDPHVALGLLLARGGHLDDARAELLAASRLSGGDPLLKARTFRALARIDQKSRPTDAAAELLEALKLSPETAEDTLLTAELAGTSGSSAAEGAYRRMLALQPNDPAATAALAHLLLQQKRPEEVEPLLAGALAIHPGDAALTTQLALLYRAQGKTAQALPLLEGLHAAEPQDANVSHLLAGLYLESGDDSRAEPLLASLAAHSPKHASLLEEDARALIHLRRFAEAQRVLTPLVAQPALFATPAELGEAAGDLAFACSQNNDPAGALRALEVRATVLPTSAPVLFLSAISHDKLHHVKLAEQAYKEFLEASNGSNPDEEFEARHRLVTLQHVR